jgi:divalent metal cation (Fe/Co/Zn/Cd) transporter
MAGRVSFVEFHLVVDGDMTVEQSHTICDRLEAALKREVEGIRVIIHVEPGHKAKDEGVQLV